MQRDGTRGWGCGGIRDDDVRGVSGMHVRIARDVFFCFLSLHFLIATVQRRRGEHLIWQARREGEVESHPFVRETRVDI